MVTINSIDSNIPIEISKGGTNTTSFANVDGVCYYDGTGISTTAVGTSGQVLTSNGAGIAPTFNGIAVLQQVRNNIKTLVNCNVAIPWDNTIPQQTEGVEVLTVTITPVSSTSTLVINFSCFASTTGSTFGTVALFQDSTANSLCAYSYTLSGNPNPSTITLNHYMTSGTTSATTFKIRIGNQGNTPSAFVNGQSSSTLLYGGVAEAIITITEYAV